MTRRNAISSGSLFRWRQLNGRGPDLESLAADEQVVSASECQTVACTGVRAERLLGN